MRRGLIFFSMVAWIGIVSNAAAGEVVRAQFTTAIVDREPIDDIVTLSSTVTEVHFFSELKDFDGETITHRWEFGGRVVAEVPFKVGGPRWRVHSTKAINSDQLGVWTVVVVNGQGNPLRAVLFEYTQGPTTVTPSP